MTYYTITIDGSLIEHQGFPDFVEEYWHHIQASDSYLDDHDNVVMVYRLGEWDWNQYPALAGYDELLIWQDEDSLQFYAASTIN